MLDLLFYFHWYLSKKREYPGIHQLLKELYEEPNLSKEKWEQLQIARLRKLLLSAEKTVPYYRKIFKIAGFDPHTAKLPADMKKIPVLTKSIVQDNQKELVADNITRKSLIENSTGGSTGNPLTFYQDKHYQTVSNALDVYVRSWWKIKPYDKTALIWGADRDFNDLSYKERLYAIRNRVRGLNAFKMTEQSLSDFCLMLRKWRPPYLMGYSSSLEELAKYVINKNINNLNFKAIRSSAEMLWPNQRETIKEAFNNSPIYNFYGSREVNNIAAECTEQQLHLVSSWRYLEVVDQYGHPLEDGVVGEFAVTDLSNYSMPFIRYKNEDTGCLERIGCKCRHPSPIITKLLGRSSDLIRTASGDVVHGEYFTHLFYGNKDIERFQIHQLSSYKIIIRYISTSELKHEFMDMLKEKIKTQMGDEVSIDFIRCDEIPVPPSGKYRFTISDI